ncbi:universal stress protein [Sphingomonas sp. ID1715]|uniref:universal stress protein n=1 Tax=Sphingomonas sp. ID1715 TaxID=1656898 RepID=UPI001488D654|nr:universal stress protein [Sphingomonas sp. ID1715]NNM76449.1 universal stress protein [Sphingomonas sp. ID1715]
MKNILLLVHDDAGQEARLQAALDLTRALSGHLNCIEAVQLPVIVDGIGGSGMAILLDDERQREAANRAALEPRLAREGISWSWTDTTGYLPDCVAEAAKTADLVVLNRKIDEAPAPDMRHIVSEVLTQRHALVVAVADSCRGFDAGGKAIVAWDGSERAMSTLQRAVPLLALASDVKIFQVGEHLDDALTVEEGATYLSRHGIHAEVEIAPATSSIAVAIREEAERFGAAYLVMGAYSHSRVREALFGGVTRAMLSACNLPMVLGH